LGMARKRQVWHQELPQKTMYVKDYKGCGREENPKETEGEEEGMGGHIASKKVNWVTRVLFRGTRGRELKSALGCREKINGERSAARPASQKREEEKSLVGYAEGGSGIPVGGALNRKGKSTGQLLKACEKLGRYRNREYARKGKKGWDGLGRTATSKKEKRT